MQITMTPEESRRTDDDAIRAVIDAITSAVRTKDVDAMLALCAPDFVAFDMVPPLNHEGAEAIRSLWVNALGPFLPPLEYEVRELEIAADGDVAFSRSLNRFAGTRADGRRVVNWLRSTLGFRRVGGQWGLTHQHVSVPFDMTSGKAMFDLKP